MFFLEYCRVETFSLSVEVQSTEACVLHIARSHAAVFKGLKGAGRLESRARQTPSQFCPRLVVKNALTKTLSEVGREECFDKNII